MRPELPELPELPEVLDTLPLEPLEPLELDDAPDALDAVEVDPMDPVEDALLLPPLVLPELVLAAPELLVLTVVLPDEDVVPDELPPLDESEPSLLRHSPPTQA